jgi:hypothetical protein
MIRTLAIVAAASFLLCVGCLAAAFAIAGGPFSIDPSLHFHNAVLTLGDGAADKGVTFSLD